MSRYIILAESGGDVPADLASRYGIYIIPMHVNFDTETKDDGFFPVEELFDFYKRTHHLPKTAACNIYDYNKIFDRIHAEHPEAHIIYLAYSAVTTSSYASGLLAMEGRDYITAFDTKHVSAGQCFVVTMVARYIEANPDTTVEDIIAYATKISSSTRMGFFPGDLDYLRAGGRVSNAAYLGAKILSLTPLIEIQNGYLVATSKYRGKMDRIAPKMLKDFSESQRLSSEMLYLIFSAGLPESLKAELTSQARDMGYKEVRWIQTGSVVSTHSGPAAFGIVGMTEDER